MTADARSAQRVEGGRIGGDMLWFNNEKGHGFIETATGDRLRVEGSGFRNGPPEGRCAGMAVTFPGNRGGEAGRGPPVTTSDDAAPLTARSTRHARLRG